MTRLHWGRELFLTALLMSAAPLCLGHAKAADLNAPRVIEEPEPPFLGPAQRELGFNWSGGYVGGFLGYEHAVWDLEFIRNNNHGFARSGADGYGAGGYIGYNYEFRSHFVLGVEADLGTTNASQNNEIFDNDDSLASYGTFGSVRARVGYAFDRLMIYGTGGWAYGNVTNEIQKGQNAGEQIVADNVWRNGWALGAGADYAFSDHWIGRAEYIYSNLGTITQVNADGNTANMLNEENLFRVGLAYKF